MTNEHEEYLESMQIAMTLLRKMTLTGGQMTLGGLIEVLESIPADTDLDALKRPHSYRGYYEDIAFERGEGKMKARELLELCKSAKGETFFGFKGGTFTMRSSTIVWIAEYGSTGDKLMGIRADGTYETAED